MSVQLRQVHHALVRAMGMNPQTTNFNDEELGRHADVINNRVRFGYEAEFWPLEMSVLEVTFGPNEPRLVLFEDPEREERIGMLDLNAAVYAEHPDYKDVAPIQGVRFVRGGIVIQGAVPETVYVRYRPPTPEFSLRPWDTGQLYFAGDLAYVPNEGDCYRALTETGAERPNEFPEIWEKVVFPEFLLNYVRYGAHADLLSEDVAKRQSATYAEAELERLRDLFLEQGGSGRRVSFRR